MRTALIVVVSALIFAILAVLPQYLKDLRSAKKALSLFRTEIVDTPITAIEYYRTGQGNPILISHGITGGPDQGLGLAKCYIGGEYDLIAVSRFGYLGSPLPKDSSPDAQADVYKHLIDKLGIDKTFIFGNSAGGTSAIKFALKYPDRCLGLILVSSIVPSKVKSVPKAVMQTIFGSNFIYWSFVNLMGDNMLSFAGVPKANFKGLTRQEKDVLLNDIIMGGFPIESRTKGIINDMYVSNPDINNNYAFEQIKVPVLMFSAMDDTLCSYQESLAVSKKISIIDFVEFEKGGHIILGNENEIQKRIANFIETIFQQEVIKRGKYERKANG